MNKEEILKKSRQENQKADEMEIAVHYEAKRMGMYAGFFVLIAILLYYTFILKHPSIQVEVFMVIAASCAIEEFLLYAKLRRKRDILFGIIGLALFVMELIIFLVVRQYGRKIDIKRPSQRSAGRTKVIAKSTGRHGWCVP